MKRISFVVIMLVVFCIAANADYALTRGPDIGEIYFIGPTSTGNGIYRSTDFGESATCMDSTLNTNIDIMSIAADLTLGVLYGFAMPENLYISYDYGVEGSWAYRNSGMHIGLCSGVNAGQVYNAIVSHSENFGIDFISHSYNGFFGNLKGIGLDNQSTVAYATVFMSSVPDSVYLLISYDNFENLEILKVLNYDQQNGFCISRGVLYGETFIIDSYFNLFHSTDYSYTWNKNNEFNFFDFYKFGAVGGRQEGEYYMMLTFNNVMGENKHIYIYHSIDYGRTFEVSHPFSKGEEPLFANFSASLTEGTGPLTVQFCNYSIGDILLYEWDFDNDGIIDSYDMEPEYTYQDSGYYTVRLVIHNQNISNEFLREDYIHIVEGNSMGNEELIQNTTLSNYPNPFNPFTVICYEFPANFESSKIEIYNLKGQIIDTITINNRQFEVIWDAEKFSSGIYLYKLDVENSPIKKMILLK